MAIAQVGTYTLSSNGADAARTLGAGNLLVIMAVWEDTANLPTGCTVGGSAATQVNAGIYYSGSGAKMYFFPNTTSGSKTISVTFGSGAAAPHWIAVEFSGVATSTPLDTNGTGSGGSTTTPTTNATATSQANELLIGVGKNYGGSTATVNTSPSNWNEIIDGGASPPYGTEIQFLVVSSTGTYNYNSTLSSSWAWAAVFASFKEAAAVSITPTIGSLSASGVASRNDRGIFVPTEVDP